MTTTVTRKYFKAPEGAKSKSASSSENGVEESASAIMSRKYRSRNALFRGTTRELVEMIDRNLIGLVFQGPFGPRQRCIEDFVRDNVLPYYGNTHTTTTITSSQTTMFRQEAKDIVRNAVEASEHDVVIFCGFGCTGAVHKLIQAVMGGNNTRPPPIVFVGPFEHHSNFLPWKDVGAKVVIIPETKFGVMDVEALEERLQAAVAERVEGRRLIGNFSVASNITGCLTDDVAVTVLMHKYNGLAFWDYSAAAAHIKISMNPVVLDPKEEGMGKKDAMFFSGHKLIGGPQTPGVLVAKKSLFQSPVPNGGGGGSVFFVTEDSHRYLQNMEYREEGGTPAIIESIRLGLVFRLKETVGPHSVISREAVFSKKILEALRSSPEITVLGSDTEPRLPIISFIVQHLPSGYYLHHNYVVALLNDLFGIQSRGGCACAGPYGQSLLGIDIDLARKYENLLLEDSRLDRAHLRRDLYLEGSHYEIFRPGFVRLSIPFYASSQDIDYLIEAVQLVAKYGHKLLPLYDCNPETGEFHHHANHNFQHRKWLSWGVFDSQGIRYKERARNNSEDCPNRRDCMEQAKTIFSNARDLCKRRTLADQSLLYESAAKIRWFLLPSEALNVLSRNSAGASVKSPKPFRPKVFEQRPAIETVYYANSVPSQVLQSAWCEETTQLKCVSRTTISLDSAVLNGSFRRSHRNSKSMDYENTGIEFLVTPGSLGATVAHPPMYFTPSKVRSDPSIGQSPNRNIYDIDSHVTKTASRSYEIKHKPTSEPRQMFSNMSINGDTWTVAVNGVNDPFFAQARALARPPFPFPDDPTVPPSSPSVKKNHLIYVDRRNSKCSINNTNVNPVPEIFCPPPNDNRQTRSDNYQIMNGVGGNVQSQTQVYQPLNLNPEVHSLMPNEYQQHSSLIVDPPYQPAEVAEVAAVAECNSPCFQNFELQPQPNLDNQYYSAPEFGTNLSSPIMTPSPVPPQHPMDCNALPKVSGSPQNHMATPISESTVSEQMVESAMRRVTDQIAIELKSEIRGVISQVEQGIEGGLRERANSFTFKDRKIESLKRRSRTLSGNSLSKKSSAAGLAQKLDKTFNPTKLTISNGINQYADGDHNDDVFDTELSPKPQNKKEDMAEGRPTKTRKINGCITCKLLPSTQPTEKIGSETETTFPKSKWHCPPKNIFKATLEALREYCMIMDGDKVLVCLSGGKDSLSLLHCMRQAQHVLAKEGVNFLLGAVTVDPKHPGFNPKPLIPYMKSLGVPYFYEEQHIMDTALEKGPQTVTSICSFCSRLKRGRIYEAARRNGYNVLAFGQHLDDLAESFMMSVFHNGFLRTMKASYTIKEEDLRVIRPFVYVREKYLREFAESRGLPIIAENCPACFDAPQERHRVKQLLAHQEILFPKIFLSIRTAIKPLMAIDRTGMESRNFGQQVEYDED